MEHSGGGEGPPTLFGRLCETCSRGSWCKQMLSYGDSATKWTHSGDCQCWQRSGREPRGQEKDGARLWDALGHILTWGAMSPASSCFFPSFPAEGNNLSPEQIKSDLHEIKC